MIFQQRSGLCVTGLALALVLGACSSSSNSTSPSSPALTASEADTAAAVLTNDADALSDGATGTGSANVGAAFSIVPVAGRVVTNSNPPLLCHPTRSPLPVVNSDSDAVPDSVRVDWTGCLINHPFATESLAGTIDYIDPTPTVTDHALKRVFTNFLIQTRRILRGDTISDEWNGTQNFNRDSSQGAFTETAFTRVHTFPRGQTATHVTTWASSFVADTPGTIVDDTPLPSGKRTITGTSTWTYSSKTWSFAVTTNPPLHRNDNCTTVPLFDSGTMTVVATRPSETTTLTIVFTGCGTYTVTRS